MPKLSPRSHETRSAFQEGRPGTFRPLCPYLHLLLPSIHSIPPPSFSLAFSTTSFFSRHQSPASKSKGENCFDVRRSFFGFTITKPLTHQCLFIHSFIYLSFTHSLTWCDSQALPPALNAMPIAVSYPSNLQSKSSNM